MHCSKAGVFFTAVNVNSDRFDKISRGIIQDFGSVMFGRKVVDYSKYRHVWKYFVRRIQLVINNNSRLFAAEYAMQSHPLML